MPCRFFSGRRSRVPLTLTAATIHSLAGSSAIRDRQQRGRARASGRRARARPRAPDAGRPGGRSGARRGSATASTASTARRRASACTRSTRRRRRSAARCTSATSSPSRTPTRSRAISGCAGGRSSTRWAGTTTACRPSGACRTTSACAATRRCPTTPTFTPPAEPSEKEPVAVSRPNFVELCLALTETDEQAFEELWRTLGLSVDWSMTYTTIGALAQRISQRSFLGLLARGAAYQLEAPTLWDVDFQTAVAQAELEDRERPGAMHRVRFAPADAGSRSAATPALIETTRPELIAGVRGAAGPPRRRAPARARRQRGADAAVRHARARADPPAGRARQGDGPGDGVHVRRPAPT